MPTIRRRSWPAVLGGGLAAVGIAVGASVAALSSGPPAASSGQFASGTLASGPASSAASASSAGTANPANPAPAASPGAGSADGTAAATLTGSTMPKLIVPDVIASVPGGVTAADLAALRRLPGVRATLAIDGARITVNGARLTVLAASAAALRPWTPP